jgi:O-antigen/teichoic acid export membrane protein
MSRVVSLLKERFVNALIFNLIGTVFSQGGAFLTVVLLARVLGKEVFGEFGMIQSTMLTMTSIAQISTGLMATKYVAEFKESDKARAGRILRLCSIMTIATGLFAFASMLFAAPFVSDRLLNAPHLTLELKLASVFVLFAVINGYQIGALTGLEAFRPIALTSFFLSLVHLGVCFLGVYTWGLNGAVGGMSLSAFMRWVVYGILLRHRAKLHGIVLSNSLGQIDWSLMRRFAIPAALGGITTMPSIWFANSFLVNQANGYAEMGTYSAALNLRTIVLFIPALINGVAISIINSHRGVKNIQSYQNMFILNICISMFAALSVALVLWLFGPKAMKVFGADFTSENTTIMISFMSLSVLIEALGIGVNQLIQCHEKMWFSFYLIALPRDIILALSAFFLTHSYGATGLAGAVLIAHSAALLAILLITVKNRLFYKI